MCHNRDVGRSTLHIIDRLLNKTRKWRNERKVTRIISLRPALLLVCALFLLKISIITVYSRHLMYINITLSILEIVIIIIYKIQSPQQKRQCRIRHEYTNPFHPWQDQYHCISIFRITFNHLHLHNKPFYQVSYTASVLCPTYPCSNSKLNNFQKQLQIYTSWRAAMQLTLSCDQN